MGASKMRNASEESSDILSVLTTLESYQRSKILEIYFARLDGREPKIIEIELRPLYEIDLAQIKAFLLGQYPKNDLLSKIFRIMN